MLGCYAPALLGDIICISKAEAAISNRDYHDCFLAVVDNHYMMCLGLLVGGGQQPGRTELFRKEVEFYRIYPTWTGFELPFGSPSPRHREVAEY